jgi:Mor family transcriptional regulator
MDKQGAANLPPLPLPEKYRRLVDIIGEDATRKLCKECGGDAMYIPKEDGMIQTETAQKIYLEWNGGNTDQLARKYKLTRRMIQYIVKGKRPPEVKGQISMLEILPKA